MLDNSGKSSSEAFLTDPVSELYGQRLYLYIFIKLTSLVYSYLIDRCNLIRVNLRRQELTGHSVQCTANIWRHWNRVGHAVAKWLRHNATSWKVAGSRRDEVNEFFQFT
jgi:hypothetical protein